MNNNLKQPSLYMVGILITKAKMSSMKVLRALNSSCNEKQARKQTKLEHQLEDAINNHINQKMPLKDLSNRGHTDKSTYARRSLCALREFSECEKREGGDIGIDIVSKR